MRQALAKPLRSVCEPAYGRFAARPGNVVNRCSCELKYSGYQGQLSGGV